MNTDLIICRNIHGVTVLPPDDDPSGCLTIKELFAKSFYSYLMDLQGRLVIVNDAVAELYSLESPRQAVGKTIYNFTHPAAGDLIRANDIDVLNRNKIKLIEETIVHEQDFHETRALTIKYPCYNSNNILTGILGFSINMNSPTIIESISYLMQLGLLNSYSKPGISIHALQTANQAGNYPSLSKRQTEIVTRLVKGFTLKEIANDLNLSKRTIEHYITAIKTKLNLTSKFDIIKKYHGLDN